jgi:hypothetical protein
LRILQLARKLQHTPLKFTLLNRKMLITTPLGARLCSPEVMVFAAVIL